MAEENRFVSKHEEERTPVLFCSCQFEVSGPHGINEGDARKSVPDNREVKWKDSDSEMLIVTGRKRTLLGAV